MADGAALIGIDWGTSSFRGYRIAGDGRVLETRAAPAGILQVADGAFEAVLERELGAWLAAAPDLPVLASGMITSRQGWVEVPYCACPAGSAELAAALRRHMTGAGRAIHFVPGLSIVDAASRSGPTSVVGPGSQASRSGPTSVVGPGSQGSVPDVIRGEETQIIGELADEPGGARRAFVLPGTHSKWAYAENHRIVWFATFMTGEVFAVLKAHSILGRLMAGDAADEAAFARGLAYGRTGPGGLLKRLFSARTLGLFDQLPASAIGSYLSGLLIGSEIAEARSCLPDLADGSEITVIGGLELAARYRVAIEAAGLCARTGHADAGARGQLRIARAAGLVR